MKDEPHGVPAGASADEPAAPDPGERDPGERDPRDPRPGEDAEREARGRAYRADGITVYFDARKCIHSGVCVRGMPLVFDVKRRPWIRADLDTPSRIAEHIDRCPSGALSYAWPESAPEAESSPA